MTVSVSGLPSVEEVARVVFNHFAEAIGGDAEEPAWDSARKILALFTAAVPRIQAEATREAVVRVRGVFPRNIRNGSPLDLELDRIESEAGKQ